LILLAIGYFIKRILDNKSKKIEINHSLFQQNRIISVNNFFSHYSKVESMWNQIAINKILSNSIDVKEIDKIIFPPLNELNRTFFELKIYFSDDDLKYFEELTDGLVSINRKLNNLYFEQQNEMSLLERSNEFFFFRASVLKNNNEILNKLCQRIKYTFKEL
jgi:hypothetical protein